MCIILYITFFSWKCKKEIVFFGGGQLYWLIVCHLFLWGKFIWHTNKSSYELGSDVCQDITVFGNHPLRLNMFMENRNITSDTFAWILCRKAYNNNNFDICTESFMNNREMNNNKTNRISIILDNEMFTITCGQL